MDKVIAHGPDELSESTVQYWSKHTKELAKSQVSKALKFVHWGCLRYIGPDLEFGSKYCFVCLPLNTALEVGDGGRVFPKESYDYDYNKTVYKIYKQDGEFCCNCQGWNTKSRKGEIPEGGAGCCHVLALFYAFKLKRFGRQHGAEDKHFENEEATAE